MSHQDTLIATDIIGYLKAQENKSYLRFITCGSVDDGKSTLIGRLLYDSHLIYEDQMAAIENDSKKSGTTGDTPDLALLVDGLAAEREQGITIDVAYRFFSTDKRKFIVADTPGHEQYTRNMATGASTADVAIILIDARHGVQTQTRRHSYITSLLGIKHVVVAINKMDLLDFSEERFNEISADYHQLAEQLNFTSITCIPMSALDGDNITTKSDRANWYQGPTLIEYLETVDVSEEAQATSFRLPVQWVNRPNLNFRGYSGTIAGGRVTVGDDIIVTPSGKRSKVKEVLSQSGSVPAAVAGEAITLRLEDEIDISRGDVISSTDDVAEQSNQFQTQIIWMNEKSLFPGRQYIFKINNQLVRGSVTDLKAKININNFETEPAKKLDLNEVGLCNISLSKDVPFDPYNNNKQTGSYIIIDRMTNETVGVGMINFSLRRAANIVWQDLEVGKKERASLKHQRSAVLWFTGLSGSGKSTIANLVEKKLYDLGRHTYILDGDNVRHGLNKDLGFTDADRVENIRRVAETSKLMTDAGLITLVSFISPFREERRMARNMLEDGEFIEIYVNTPLEVAEERDVKGLYKKARAGEIKNFTGIDSEYQPPKTAEIEVNTVERTAEQAADFIMEYLEKHGFLDAL